MRSKFNYNQDFKKINFREHPELYQVGIGEQGVLLVEPYKSEILPYWKFKTPEIAKESSAKIYELFLNYKKNNDFIGMDMSRKFLQMGYTRSRRYANHKSGKKYDENKNLNPQENDWATSEKAESARIFYEKYILANEDENYKELKKHHQKNIQSK